MWAGIIITFQTMKEKTIKLCGKDVSMIYCAATENGYEEIAGKSISVFVPTFDKDKEGNTIVTEPAKANISDFVKLAVSGIIAAYARKQKEPPVTSDEILYEATPAERNEMLEAIVELRNEWYGVPKVLKDAIESEKAEDAPKNE